MNEKIIKNQFETNELKCKIFINKIAWFPPNMKKRLFSDNLGIEELINQSKLR